VARGVDRQRVRLVRPGVDLDRFRPIPVSGANRFALLFASTPSEPEDIELRGIPLLVELARTRPDIEIVVPWRQWGNVAAAKARLQILRPPDNFVVLHQPDLQMSKLMERIHATIACFAPGIGKGIPNFVLEGLAAGRPFVASPASLSELARRTDSGIAANATVESLSQAIDDLRDGWAVRSVRAREVAETYFDVRRFVREYEVLYEDIVALS
jgi:glycosyltransferase involved in cell wall biosynthesis